MRHEIQKIEFGDFQTPLDLSKIVFEILKDEIENPNSILEPTCGVGNILSEAVQCFPKAKAFGVEVNQGYVDMAQSSIKSLATIQQGDFFTMAWSDLLDQLPDPLLVVGNPPWVTNSQLGGISGTNLPDKTNFQKHTGLEAITGKSNFDISEWIMLNIANWLNNRNSTMAMICKTSVARKILKSLWQSNKNIVKSSIYLIDTKKYFDAAVDSCLLICKFGSETKNTEANIYDIAQINCIKSSIAWRKNQLVANLDYFEKFNYLIASEKGEWRSGIKHDSSAVMELEKEGDFWINGYGEKISLEDDYIFPLLKTSDVANGRLSPRRWMIVTQKTTGEETHSIEATAPKTWKYLCDHSVQLDSRASSIYRNRPRFSIFGIGPYVFTPWKIAISGMYKKIAFQIISPFENKPMVFDDATYFLPCQNESEARKIYELLNSNYARKFFESFIFWDAKRPITVELLNKLNLDRLAIEFGTTLAKSKLRLDL